MKTALVIIGRRVLQGVAVLAAVSVLTFVLAELAPGEFTDELVLDPRISAESLEELRQRYGLDQPLHQRYLGWLGSLARGELGFSFAHGRPVAELLPRRALDTLFLALPATLAAWLLALILGTWAAAHPRGWTDRASSGLSALLLALPEVVLGLFALRWAVTSGLFPAGGMSALDNAELGPWGRVGDVAHHLVLPAAVLAAAALPTLLGHVRSAVAEALEAPFLAAARGHGIPPRQRLFRWALPAAAPTLLPLFGLSLGALVSGSLVVEVLFGWPGLGPLMLEAILARDLHVVTGTLLVSAAFLIGGQLVADLLLIASDPRLRRRAGR